MSRRIDYYFTLVSPWAYIGHALFVATARKHRLTVDYRPINVGTLYPASGGLPVAQRHPLRQRYRLLELQRWREKRGLRFALAPKHWPFDPTLADCCVIALAAAGVDPGAFVAATFKAAFEAERNLGDSSEVAAVLNATGADAARILADAQTEAVRKTYAANCERAIAAGVFGSPTYVLDGEAFWGQDRIELLNDALTSGRAPYRAD